MVASVTPLEQCLNPPAAVHDSEEEVAAFVSLLATDHPVTGDPIGSVAEDTGGAGSGGGLNLGPDTSASAWRVGEAVTARSAATPLKVCYGGAHAGIISASSTPRTSQAN